MAQAKGSQSIFTMADEATFGTADGAGNHLRLPIVSAELALSQSLVESRVLSGTRNPSEPFLDEKTVQGSVVIQPDIRSISHVLRHLLGSVTTSGTGPYVHEIKPAASLPTGITFQKYYSDIAIALQYVGCKINGMSFEVGAGGALEITLEVMGADETDAARIDAAPLSYAVVPFRLGSATLTQGGSGLLTATRFSLNINNEIEQVRTIGNGGKIHSLPEGFIRASGNLTVLFESMAQYDKAKDGTEDSLLITFPATTAVGHQLELEMQEVRYAVTSPPIPGPNGILCSMDWQAFTDDGSEGAAVVARVTNDIASIATIAA